jgi:hypothetical protein
MILQHGLLEVQEDGLMLQAWCELDSEVMCCESHWARACSMQTLQDEEDEIRFDAAQMVKLDYLGRTEAGIGLP